MKSIEKNSLININEKLLLKKQQAFANLLAVLDEKQFKLLQKYLTIEEKLNKEQTKELITRIVNK